MIESKKPKSDSGNLRIEKTLQIIFRVKLSKIGSLIRYITNDHILLLIKSLLSIFLSFSFPNNLQPTRKMINASKANETCNGIQDFLPCFMTRQTQMNGLMICRISESKIIPKNRLKIFLIILMKQTKYDFMPPYFLSGTLSLLLMF